MPSSRALPGFVAATGVALLVLVGPGCATDTPSRGELTEALEASGLSAEVSACAADAVIDSLSADELTELVERGGGGAPVDDPDVPDDSADQLRDALSACRTLLAEEAAASTTTAP